MGSRAGPEAVQRSAGRRWAQKRGLRWEAEAPWGSHGRTWGFDVAQIGTTTSRLAYDVKNPVTSNRCPFGATTLHVMSSFLSLNGPHVTVQPSVRSVTDVLL